MVKSIKPPAGTVTEPVAVHSPPLIAEQESAEFVIEPGVPVRNVTVIVFDC
jgi:hypothetical protein